MNLKINRSNFASALSDAVPFSTAKSNLIILKYAKVTTKGNRLKIEATNNEMAIVRYMTADEICGGDGEFLIEIAEVNKFISNLKCDTVEIIAEKEMVTFKHSKGKASFATVDAKEYPTYRADNDDYSELVLPSTILSGCISKGKGFVSNDPLRPQLCSIYAYTEEGVFGYCATDTRKLIHDSSLLQADACPNVKWYLIPSAFSALLKLCRSSELVTIKVGGKHVVYRAGDTIIYTSQILASYPDFKRVIPSAATVECSVDKASLLDTLSRTSLFCDETRVIRAEIGREELTVSADNSMCLRGSTESISHNGCNDSIRIGVNVDNFITAISAIDDNDVALHMTDASHPIVLSKDNLRIVVMPLIFNA